VVVDQRYDIHYINGEARRVFGIHAAALDQDLIHLLQHFDPLAVRRAIDEATRTGKVARHLLAATDSPVEVERTLELICTVIAPGNENGERLVVVTTTDVTEREQLRRRQENADALVTRLTRANDEVLAANEELTLTVTRLRGENEELLVATEEIQAATEEVETLNEELQASNEELETLNEELQATVEELNTTNDDLQARTIELQAMAIEGEMARRQLRAVLEGIDDAVIVVDEDGAVILRNGAYTGILEGGDGIRLLDVDGELLAADETPIPRAARGERFRMTFAIEADGATTWYVATCRPVPSDGNGRLGVVTIRETDAPD